MYNPENKQCGTKHGLPSLHLKRNGFKGSNSALGSPPLLSSTASYLNLTCSSAHKLQLERQAFWKAHRLEPEMEEVPACA